MIWHVSGVCRELIRQRGHCNGQNVGRITARPEQIIQLISPLSQPARRRKWGQQKVPVPPNEQLSPFLPRTISRSAPPPRPTTLSFRVNVQQCMEKIKGRTCAYYSDCLFSKAYSVVALLDESRIALLIDPFIGCGSRNNWLL